MNLQLTQVDERKSEDGFKVDMDQKEYEYREKIEVLQKRIDDIKRITQLTQREIEAQK